MITGFFLSVFYYFVSFFIGLLPQGGAFPAQFAAAINTVWQYANQFTWLLPIETLLQVLALALTFHLSVFAFRAVKWTVHLMRGN